MSVTMRDAAPRKAPRSSRHAGCGTASSPVTTLTPDFFRRFAHDLTNTLAGVRGAVDILASRAAEGPDTEFARAAINDLKRADALLHDATTYVAPPPLDIRIVKVRRLIDEALQQAGQLPRLSGMCINVTSMNNVSVEADVAQLGRALAEVVRNAAEAGTATSKVRVAGSLEGNMLLIEVTNDAPAARPLDACAFEPLLTTKRGHAGLGLSIAQQVVEAHGGTIELDGAGHAATVRIRLPVRKSEAVDCPTPPERS